MSMREVLDKLAQGRDLTEEEAGYAFGELMDGLLHEAVAGALLMGLRTKGETALELACGVRQALNKAHLVTEVQGKRIDTCGTGGDGKCTFNCSTAVALFLADMGHQVVKHGNRAVSSSCGSADVVEELGLPMGLGPDQIAPEIAKRGFAFLFAPVFHPAFAKVVPIRKELGIRTLFNLMGPLLNPARPTHQILGVPRGDFAPLMAEALALTGIERACVVHGAGGYDELTCFGPSDLYMVEDGKVSREVFDPRALGFTAPDPAELSVSGKAQALESLKALFRGEGQAAQADMVAANLALALHLLDAEPLKDCVKRARDKVAEGLTGDVLDA